MKIVLKIPGSADPVEIIKEGPVILEELAAEYRDSMPYDVMLARVDGRVAELTQVIDEDSAVEFLDIRTRGANLVYQYTVSLLYLKSVRDVLGDVETEIDHSLNKGLFTLIKTPEPVTEEQVAEIEQRMRDLAAQDVPIVKEVFTREEGLRLLEKYHSPEKARLLENTDDVTHVKFYSIEGYRYFFYGKMAPSTGYVKLFELKKYRDGVLIRLPYPEEPDRLPEFRDDEKLHMAFYEAKKWQELLGVAYLADLNQKVKDGEAKELVLLSEALHEKKIAEIADKITEEKKRIVLIAGPSSSGKTTFAKRLCVQLKVNGAVPLYLGTDDYFLEREETPIGPDGRRNFEDLDALDIKLFNKDMNDLLAGKEVDLPEFDFITGRKVFGKRVTSIAADQPIVIEGIHALNNELTAYIDDEEKCRIYISPLTQLNVDLHNRVSTTDARLLRRMVRDSKYRDRTAAQTIDQWAQVRAGEDKNIFPYNGEADVLFNSHLAYEIAVLKKYAEPLLKEVKPDEPEYSEAARLLKFIRYFAVMDDERAIPNNSIMREFIGGSVFTE